MTTTIAWALMLRVKPTRKRRAVKSHAQRMSRASREPRQAFPNSFFARLVVRVSLSSATERSTDAHRAGSSSDIARPSDADQARAAIPSGARAASAGSSFRVSLCFLEFTWCSRFLKFSRVSRADRANLGAEAPKGQRLRSLN